jgi:hypothetical protein
LIRGAARTAVVAGTATVVAGRVHHHQHEKWAQEDYEEQLAYEQQAAPQAAPVSPPVSEEDDLIHELQQLASLHDAGALTDDEFTTAKAQLLGS